MFGRRQSRPFPLRWRFPDPRETDARAAVQRRIDAWWKAFVDAGPELDALFSGRKRWDLPGWMDRHLHAITPDIFWEFGPGITGRHRLVITAEGNRHRRQLVTQILASAPPIAGWDFLPHRPPETGEALSATVEGRTGVALESLRVRVEEGRFGTIGLTFLAADLEVARRGGFVAAESALGEEVLERWIGFIEFEKGLGLPIPELKPTVDALVERRRNALPDLPWHDRVSSATWSVLKATPGKGDELPGQGDLIVGVKADTELFENFGNGQPFASERFSKHGETFAFLKIDGSEGLPEGGFQDRGQIENAIDQVLLPTRLGCSIGGGTGTRYSYVDLALIDVDRALPALLEVLRRGKLPLRSWIQFFDSDLRWEWVGVWPDTPAPPLDSLPE